MRIRTFWKILIKFLGVWILLGGLSIIPNWFIFFKNIFLNRGTTDFRINEFVLVALLAILLVGIYYSILSLLIFKTSWIIDKLKLDKEFDEENIELDLNKIKILRIAFIVIGGIMIIDAFPGFVTNIYIILICKIKTPIYSAKVTWLIYYIFKILIGTLLMYKNKVIVKLIDKENTSE